MNTKQLARYYGHAPLYPRCTVKELKELLTLLPPEDDNNYIIFKHNPEILALEYLNPENIYLLDIQAVDYSNIKEKI